MNIAEDLIRDKDRMVVSVKSGSTLGEAIAAMREQNVGCILVDKDGEFVGIWTERDLLHDVAQHGARVETQLIDMQMSSPLLSCEWDDSVYKLMDMILGLRVRHLLVRKCGKYIGLLSIGDVLKAAVREKNRELADLNSAVSWDYYEEWKRK